MSKYKSRGQGWFKESHRHSLAAKGVRTARNIHYRANGTWLETVPNQYGGIPSFGGYGHYTEYEIGAGHMSEAAHCILGSMQETIKADEHIWHRYAHIQEELDNIERDLYEYSKETYSGEFVWRSPEYGPKSLESMRENSPKLRTRAEAMRTAAEQDNTISQEDKRVLLATYDFIIHLTRNVEKSVEGVEHPPIPYEKNAYNDPILRLRYYRIKDAVEEAFPEEAKR